ncbi:DUF2249 domain-containing protein [Halobacteriaceae archaeon GCM10025711]
MPAQPTDDIAATLDAREIDGEPFGDIMAAVDDLDDDETLLLVNSFEPTPLLGVLGTKGYDTATEQVDEDEWHVYIAAE